ncbi:MAG: hypothetical protein RIR62_1053 [Pseudomonadota bacterium]
MTIGTVLFGRIATESFGKLSSELAALQGRIASGKNDPRPSDDPMRGAQLSAVREQRGALERFTDNARLAADRLAHADLALGEVSGLVRQFMDISLRAANDTMTQEGLSGLRAEAVALRQALLAAANRTDTMGQPLFAGLGGGAPFEETAEGIAYRGDGGRPVLRMTETAMLATGVNGGEVFGAIPTASGDAGLFAMVDDMIAALEQPLSAARPAQEAKERARLTPLAGREGGLLSLTLTGPKGSATIEADVARGAMSALVAAINAATQETGVTATLAPDGDGVVMEAPHATLRVSDLSSDGDPRRPVAEFVPLDAAGKPDGVAVGLRAARISADSLVGAFGHAVSHLAAQRAEVGALAALADGHIAALADRRVRIDEAIAGLEDLDVAAALTRLQTLLLTEQAAQQSFVRISGTTLFDYLR